MDQLQAGSVRYQPNERVALFLPCYCDVLFPEIGRAVVTLFSRLGIPLEYPMEQTCCGQPAFNAGSWDEAQAMARRFAHIFSGYRWIVVPSGSCAAMARAFYAYMEPGSAASLVGRRVYDLASFLVDVIRRTDVGATFAARVTYHDGCHGRRELGATAASLAVLQAVRGLEYVELPKIDECCGFGGLFSVKYSELSVSMGRSKCDAITRSGAHVVTSGDASCLMHIAGLWRKDQPASSIRFLHLAEILAATA